MIDQDNARQRAIEAYENARDNVASAGRRAANGLAEAPLIALAGGLAAGALIAALLPRTASENRLVRPTARRVRASADAAVKAARATGKERLDELGLSREKGEETLNNFLHGLKDTARASADAAVNAARNKD
jgi:hypothetical protein